MSERSFSCWCARICSLMSSIKRLFVCCGIRRVLRWEKGIINHKWKETANRTRWKRNLQCLIYSFQPFFSLSLRSPLNRLSPYILVGKTYALLLLISRGITTSPRRLNCPFKRIYCASTHKEKHIERRTKELRARRTNEKGERKLSFSIFRIPLSPSVEFVCTALSAPAKNKQSAERFQDWLTVDKLI